MSNDVFAPVTFPQLGDEAPGLAAARARAAAEGYAAGLRRAAAENRVAAAAAERAAAAAEQADRERMRAALDALGAAVVSLDSRLAPVLAEADSALAEAAVRLAEAVLAREVAEGHADGADALRRILSAVPSGRVVTVRLNPDDLRTLERTSTGPGPDAADRPAELPPDVRLRADPALAPGDAVAELRQGWLDARIGTAVARAADLLTGSAP